MIDHSERIKKYLLKHVEKYPKDIVKTTMLHFQVARTTVLRHINALIKSGDIIKTGERKQVIYTLAHSKHYQWIFSLKKSFDEASIWSQYIKPQVIKFCNKNAMAICEYTSTKMLNNAHDHSFGTIVKVALSVDAHYIHLTIQDDGIGVFQKIGTAFGLSDIRDSILELTKGKATTDPANHSGEGIFFSSRASDLFEITANQYIYSCDNENHDWIFQKIKSDTGTKIYLKIQRNTTKNIVDIFKKYQKDNSFEFEKTDIHLTLVNEFGTRLISRSQAKRVLRSLEKFSTVTLDFTDIEAVGQGFVDEIFRVYPSQRPGLKLIYINTIDDVEYMIKRGISIKPSPPAT